MKNVGAVFITHNPGPRSKPHLREAVAAVRSQVSGIFIADMASSAEAAAIFDEVQSGAGIRLWRAPEAFAIAPALNAALRWAQGEGLDWLLILDQESLCPPDFIERFREALRADAEPETVAAITPGVQLFDSDSLAGSPHLITDRFVSGTAVNVQALMNAGWFDERLYCDEVAFDAVQKLIGAGWRRVVVENVRLIHPHERATPGDLRRLSQLAPLPENPARWYYNVRNRLFMYRRITTDRARFIIRDVFAIGGLLLRLLIRETARKAKFRAFVKGLFDGLLGRTGPLDHFAVTQEKAFEYYSKVRSEVFPLLPPHSHKLLDLGCGAGVTAAAIKERGQADWVGGVELNHQAAERARERLDEVIEADIAELDQRVAADSIDTVLALDILEHLVDPWGMMPRIHRVLKPGGVLIASIPNVRHYSVILPLIFFGEFKYQDLGIMDSTHLRFFTRKSAAQLLTSTGLVLEEVGSTGSAASSGGALFHQLTFGVFRGFFDFQYLIRVRKIGKSG